MTQTDQRNNELTPINLSSVFISLKKEYKIILSTVILFPIIGVFYILNTPKEYTSIGKIMPEISYKVSNGMGGLYEILKKYNNSVDLYNTEITSTELYGEILKTKDFYDYLLTEKVKTINDKKISFKSYCDYNLQNKNSFFGNGNSDSTANSKMKHYSIQDIQKRIVVNAVKKNSIILVAVKMPDPSVAADIANSTITYLIDYITKYRTEKARQELQFIENLQKKNLEDSSKNEAFTKEMQNNLSASTIQMKIKIQEDTPIFQVLEKAQIPVMSSNTPPYLILTALIFIGFVVGVVIAFLRNNNYKLLFNSN